VVSAVGHEIDLTIADLVADLRAATPSAAAEVITQHYVNSCEFVHEAVARLQELSRRHVIWAREEWHDAVKRLSRVHPRRRLELHAQRLDDLLTALLRGGRRGVRQEANRWQAIGQRLLAARPSTLLLARRQELTERSRRLNELVKTQMRTAQTTLATSETRLRLLSPLNVLERGYSITLEAESGKVVRDASQVEAGQRLRTRLKSGEITSIAEGEGK
jgi:exodeoxyribonuclease VII large subunit